LLLLADEAHAMLSRGDAADAAELSTFLESCFAGFGTRHRELRPIADQICTWHRVASPARARALTRSALAQHAASLLRRGASAPPRGARMRAPKT
jgi:hypothetical protein